MKKRKAFTVEADEELSKKFSEQVIERGYTKYRAIEGSLRLWLTLTPHEQVELIEDKSKPVFSDDSIENEIYIALDKLARDFVSVNAKIQAFQGSNHKKKTQLRRKTV